MKYIIQKIVDLCQKKKKKRKLILVKIKSLEHLCTCYI